MKVKYLGRPTTSELVDEINKEIEEIEKEKGEVLDVKVSSENGFKEALIFWVDK